MSGNKRVLGYQTVDPEGSRNVKRARRRGFPPPWPSSESLRQEQDLRLHCGEGEDFCVLIPPLSDEDTLQQEARRQTLEDLRLQWLSFAGQGPDDYCSCARPRGPRGYSCNARCRPWDEVQRIAYWREHHKIQARRGLSPPTENLVAEAEAATALRAPRQQGRSAAKSSGGDIESDSDSDSIDRVDSAGGDSGKHQLKAPMPGSQNYAVVKTLLVMGPDEYHRPAEVARVCCQLYPELPSAVVNQVLARNINRLFRRKGKGRENADNRGARYRLISAFRDTQ